tara:strand:- start:8689 stop:9444 length:756 start_codon:yes stop_codon:yes gene_type:complete
MDYTEIPEEDQQAAQLVKVAHQYYKYGDDEANKWIDQFDLPYVIDTDSSNDLGIVVINKNTDKAKIIFRGSDPGIDWGKYPNMTDWHFDYLLLTQNEHLNPQYWRTKWLFEGAKEKYDLEECVGYSKGGNHCLTLSNMYNVNSTTFNAAFNAGNLKATSSNFGWLGLGYNYLFGSGKRDETKALHKVYRVENDPVSKGSLVITKKSHPNIDVINIKPQEYLSKTNTGIIGTNHKIEHFYDSFIPSSLTKEN